MQEFPNISIGEFSAVENERGLSIKFKVRAFPVKVRSGFMPGKCAERSARARPPIPLSSDVLTAVRFKSPGQTTVPFKWVIEGEYFLGVILGPVPRI
jgi:hypothetical protein